MVELLAAISILAILAVVAGVFVAGYINDTRTIEKKQTLHVLNDALTRYKTQGGGVTSLTAGASIGRVLRQLQTSVSWAGMSHQFLQEGMTYPARSLLAVGSGAQYHFYGYNGYEGETVAAGTPTSQYPYGSGVGYLKVVDAAGIHMTATSSSGYWAIKVGSGTPVIYASSDYAAGDGSGTIGASATFWACAGAADSTQSGNIITMDCNGADTGWNTSVLDVKGLTALTTLNCLFTGITSLDVSNHTALTSLNCSYASFLSSLNAQGCTALGFLYCSSCQLGDINVTGCTSLPDPCTDWSTSFVIEGNPSPNVIRL